MQTAAHHSATSDLTNTRHEGFESLRSTRDPDELSLEDLDTIVGGRSQTAGGGNTSVWGKIKSVWFGVDASFYD